MNSVSQYLGTRQLRVLERIGNLYIPGALGGWPSFSESYSIAGIDRVMNPMTPGDRGDFALLLTVLSWIPGVCFDPLMTSLMRQMERSYERHLAQKDLPWDGLLRQLYVGIKGVIMSLHYMDADGSGDAHRRIGFDAKINDGTTPTTAEGQAFARARSGEATLKRLTVEMRLNAIRRLKKVILENRNELVDEIQKATRKCRTDALVSEIMATVDFLEYLEKNAEKQLRDRKVSTPLAMFGKKSRVYFEPMGTILVITPWNYPFYQAIVPTTLAWVCGNSVVLKPSEFTEMRGVLERFFEKSKIPSNWIQVVYGDGKVGARLIDEKPSKIFFTGSPATGRKIMAQAAKDLIPVELELGGKDAAIVFDDVGIERAAAGVVWGAMTNSGQSCTSVERVYVHEKIADAFQKECEKIVAKLRVGIDSDGSADLGEMVHAGQAQVVREHLERSRAQGGTLFPAVASSSTKADGLGLKPVLVTGAGDGSEIVTEETFGPVLPILVFKTEEEVIARANQSKYGLSASVWSKDLNRADRVARSLKVGNVSINNVMITEGNPALPFGGVGESGFGRFKGEFGFYSFSNVKSVVVDQDAKKYEANWYPYSPVKYRHFDGLVASALSKGLVRLVQFAKAGLGVESQAAKDLKNGW